MRLALLCTILIARVSTPCAAQSGSVLQAASIAENITRFHPGCHAKADLRGGDCTAAAHRLCEANYRKDSFGFVFLRDGMDVHVGCAPRAFYGEVLYSQLREIHPSCRGQADAQSPHCVAAVRRYCSAQQGLSGGLIQETSATRAAVACFKATRLETMTYNQLAPTQRGCTQASAAGQLICVTAVAKRCRNGNQAELGLPQEVGLRSIDAACFPGRVHVVRLLDAPGRIDGR